MNRRTYRIAAVVVIAALLGGLALALRSRSSPIVERPTVLPSPLPTPARLPYTPVPENTLAPIVVQRTPARGEELQPGGSIELVFDRPMDQPAAAAAFSLTPAVPGQVQWADARTLRFTPSQPLPRAQLFDVALGQAARAADGAPLSSPYQFRFATAGFLEVGQVIPADGAQEVQPATTITVLFNRPVVPLTVVEQQANAPQPLSFSPGIAGTGEWLNTAVYVFHPAAPLAGGTSYTARVAAGLQGTDGSPLQSEYTWQFSTARPQVLSVFPQDGERLVAIERPIAVQLNQPIAAAAARPAFHLRSANGEVDGVLGSVGDTLIFTPSQRLAFDTDYQLALDAGLGAGQGGAGLAAGFNSTFHSVPLPRLLGTLPANGEQAASPYTDLALFFNTPIDPDTVMANLRMTPPLSPTQVYTYGVPIYPGDTSVPAGAAYAFHISFGAQPSRSYSAQVGPNIADPYGNRTGQSLEVAFRTAPLPPSIQLVAPDSIATYSGRGPTRVGISSVNIANAAFTLYRLPLETLRQPYVEVAGLPESAIIRRWSLPLSTPLDQPTLGKADLVEGGGTLDPGVYMLLLSQPQGPPQQHMLVVSNINVTLKSGPGEALVWANDLQTGQPVAGLPFEFFDDQSATLGSATTDSSGIARVALTRAENRWVLALARQPFAAAASSWSRGISPWDFGLPGSAYLPTLAMHGYTDRPIYRPGQVVHYKGVIRRENDAAFSLPQPGTADVTISSANGEQVDQRQLQLNANGAFDGSLTLADGAALGIYSINVAFGGQSFSFTFQVAAYRPPEFQVNVTTPAPALVRGAPIAATAEVRYFFGGPVANAPVQWSVLADSYRFSPDWGGRYQFGDTDDPWRCWECWWRPADPPRPILSGSGSTDAQGNLAISIPADLKDAQGVPITDSVRLTIEATVTGRDNQAISGRAELVLHRGQIYLGLAPRAYVGQAGEPQQIDLVASDIDSQRQPNQPIDVEIFRYSWDNRFIQDAADGHWEWSETRVPVSRQSITTNAQGEATVAFTPAEAGSYRVVAQSRDDGGRSVRSAIFVWVAGDGYAPWRRDNNDQVSLIADKTSYTPGETAAILIPSPFTQPHWALITVERGGVLSHEVRKLDGNSAVVRLPITSAHVPNVYVTVTLLSPPDANSPTADYKVGILPLAVAPDPQSLKVTVAPRTASAEPGQAVDFDVQVADLQGQPVAAELSLDLVDKAVLSLQPRTPDAIRAAFYYHRALAIGTASGLAVSGDRFLQQLDKDLERQQRERQQLPTTGAGGGAELATGTPAPAATAAPAAEAPAAPAAGRALDQAANAAAAPTIRSEFADTAYWNASVTTDASGKASVQITLPDNLTTWVLRGVGLTADTRVGEGTAELIATKPLLVRPVTPRFFVVGDLIELAANVSNNTAAPLDVQVGLATRGLSVTGQLTQTVQVPANGEARVTWPAQAQDVTSADLVFSAVSGQYADASRPRLASGPAGTLPVYRYSAPEVIGTGGQLGEAGTRTEVVGLPPNIDPRNGELTVRIDPSLAAGMRDGLDYLEHYDYECTEQTVSRFLPNILTLRALKKLGIANADLAARLPKLVDEGLNKLYLQQHGDGGWGWWPPTPESSFTESNPHISAYVVFGMLRAKEGGYAVRDDVLTRGLDYLASKLQPTGLRADQLTSADANQQAWLLYVLGEADRADRARLADLYGNRVKLSHYARAFLALALNRAGSQPSDPQIKTLLADLNSAAILSATGAHWEEDQRDWWSMNTDMRTTAIVLAALTRLDPSARATTTSSLLPNIVRWLMVARREGYWDTTQSTAWSLIALTDWMEATGELRADYDYGVWLNDAQQAAGHIGAADVQTPIVLRVRVADLLNDTGNRLAIGRGPGSGQLYYTAHLRAFLPVEQIKALDRGVVVRRRYTLASCQDGARCPAVSEVKVGDVVRVELEIVAPHDLYYLQVEDPLPAGAEAIDPSLATTSVLEQPPGLARPVPIDGARVAGGADAWFWWGWRWYNRSELRDEKVALFADYLPRGAYLYSYTMRATQAGEFRVIPTTASELYFPEVYGRADGQLLRIAAQ